MEISIFFEENRQEEREFLAHYNLDMALFEKLGFRIKQIIPAKTIYRIVTDKGFFCLRRLRFPMEETQFILNSIEHLKNNGFENVFDVVKQEDGSIFWDHEGDKYFLTRWMDGRESDFLNPLDLKSAAETLASLHEAAKGLTPQSCPKERNLLGKWPASFKAKIKEMKAMKREYRGLKDKNDIDKLYMEYVDTCIQDGEAVLNALTQTAYAELTKTAKKQGGFIHRDFSHHNILHTFDGKTYVTDFDYCAVDLRIHDVAGFILRNVRRNNWDMEKVLFILDAYNKKSPIEDIELPILKAFLAFPQDFQSVTKQYIEKRDWEEQDFIDKMSAKSEYSVLRRKFLETFETRL